MKIEYSDIRPGAILKREQEYNILFLVLTVGEDHIIGMVPIHQLNGASQKPTNAYPMGRRMDVWRGYIQYPAWSLYAPAS